MNLKNINPNEKMEKLDSKYSFKKYVKQCSAYESSLFSRRRKKKNNFGGNKEEEKSIGYDIRRNLAFFPTAAQ